MIYEILNNNTVVNTIVADLAFMQANYPNGNYREVIQETPVQPDAPYKWFIDLGPFFDRFGSVKMQVLTSSDAGVRALITDIQVRKWVDLKLPEVAQSLAYLGSVIPAVTPALQSSILNTPVGDHENLALRKLYFSA